MALVKTNGNGGLRASSLLPRTFFLDDFFNSDFPLLEWDKGLSAEWMPAANVKENAKQFSVEVSVPGYTKKDIHVEVDDNNVLHITGEHKEESKEESENYTRKEFSYGSFSRSFQLTESIDDEGSVAEKRSSS